MKFQALFSSKDKSKKIKVLSAAILPGSLRFNELVFEHDLMVHESHLH